MSYAPMKLVPGLRPSTSQARPNQVAADSLPQPNEARSARAAVITSVRASRKSGMKPPEKHAEITTTRLRMPASSRAARSCGGVIHSSSSGGNVRSEEHTSELQSLMRISYAVFCLKKKTKHTISTNRNTTKYNQINNLSAEQTNNKL